MAYTVFARKYRPQTFDALIGQEHVARTLAGAIESDRVAHAFLFTGVRGVGKTSTARLLAKALNCEKGPTPTPCNECDMCRDITAGVDMDVQEMDGASHNGVDDVRRLQESLPFRPARDRFKIVIVDEVHMLSTGAFNAFLKTLEEPPEHVKFIFATTESHKVPVTIRSRCQRYDFRLIPQVKVAASIRRVLDAEGIEADEAAVRIVAREAAGSMRDALTLLDQLVAFSGGSLNGDSVSEQLGIAAREAVHEVTRGLIEGDAPAVLRTVDSVMERSADPLHFSQQLLQYVRDAVVLRLSGSETTLVDFVDEEREGLMALVSGREPLELERAFAALAKLVDEIASASMPGLVLEMGLTRIATRPALMGVVELVRRLESLEQRLGPGGGGGGGRRRPAGDGGGARPADGNGQTAQPRPVAAPQTHTPPKSVQASSSASSEHAPRSAPQVVAPRRAAPQ
ncbi:MAG: DNA polymerase-3 subunit gamma/tau, partial [Polyangiales bacterium]